MLLPLATSQDHKRLRDGDQGPNTGGMGAYSPAPVVTPAVHARAMREVITCPRFAAWSRTALPFSGFLYAGLMVDAEGGVKTLEFNCRMGDPETQPIMMRLKTDLLDVLHAASDFGGLDPELTLQWDRRTALGVVMAAHGYPEQVRKGDAIQGPARARRGRGDVPRRHHAAGRDAARSGGRVVCVTVLADTVKAAQLRAYRIASAITLTARRCRHDIGHRAIKA
jgi:phosphoribosylamine--glycine ligase